MALTVIAVPAELSLWNVELVKIQALPARLILIYIVFRSPRLADSDAGIELSNQKGAAFRTVLLSYRIELSSYFCPSRYRYHF